MRALTLMIAIAAFSMSAAAADNGLEASINAKQRKVQVDLGIDTAPAGVQVILPFKFSDLSKKSQAEINLIVEQVKQELGIDSVVAVPEIGAIITTSSGVKMNILQVLDGGRVLVSVLDENGNPILPEEFSVFDGGGGINCAATERIYDPSDKSLRPRIAQRFDIVIDKISKARVPQMQAAVASFIEQQSPTAMCAIHYFDHMPLIANPDEGVISYAFCKKENFDNAIEDMAERRTTEGAESISRSLKATSYWLDRDFPHYEHGSAAVVKSVFFLTEDTAFTSQQNASIFVAKDGIPTMVYAQKKGDIRNYYWADTFASADSGVSLSDAVTQWANTYVNGVIVDPCEATVTTAQN